MLDFKREEVSGQLAAHSKVAPFKIYWIDEDAWVYLAVTGASKRGPYVRNEGVFHTIEGAKSAAEKMEEES